MTDVNDTDLDEVDLSILDTIAYVRQFVHSPEQAERLLFERLAAAFDMIDAGEVEILDAISIH